MHRAATTFTLGSHLPALPVAAQPGCAWWEFAASPESTAGINFLYDVDGADGVDIPAVGSGNEDESGSTLKTLAMRRDGSAREATPIPQLGALRDPLLDAGDEVRAVGQYLNGNGSADTRDVPALLDLWNAGP